MSAVKFDDPSIQRLFGHEAAEDEDPERLRNYYFKGNVFERATADLPLRVVVGHKGIGKSALFQVARQEDLEDGVLALFLRPDDVREIKTSTDMLDSIRNWKAGLLRIIYEKSIELLGTDQNVSHGTQEVGIGLRLIDSLTTLFSPLLEKVANLGAGKATLAKGFMKHKKVRVYIDDLDRGWTASRESIARISALLNAMRDLTRDHLGVQFRISLRSDVYFLVRTSDESTDKIEGSVVWYFWSNHEILAMLVKRVQAFLGNERTEQELVAMRQHQLATLLDEVMEPHFFGFGGWSKIPTHRMLMSLIRRRPRDLVKLCTSAAQKAHQRGAALIETHDFRSIFDQYSQARLQDTANEYRSELPSIETLLLNMRPTMKEKERKQGSPFIYSTAELLKKIGDIQSSQKQFQFYSGKTATSKDLAAFLYKVNFLTARRQMPDGKIERQYFEENRYLSSSFVDFGYDWEIHPAYRWTLQPEDHNEILRLLDDID